VYNVHDNTLEYTLIGTFYSSYNSYSVPYYNKDVKLLSKSNKHIVYVVTTFVTYPSQKLAPKLVLSIHYLIL
jgi:hypothetical protein